MTVEDVMSDCGKLTEYDRYELGGDRSLYYREVERLEGKKLDGGKTRWDLLPWAQVESVARVLTYGAQKYSDNNWQSVVGLRGRYLAAAVRHVVAWVRGEYLDRESSEPHLAHAVCCLLFLMWADDEEIGK
jgi:hypothetical protein